MKYLQIVERAIAKNLGMTRYFTGRSCKYGHFAERQTASFRCCECDRIDRHTPERKRYIKQYHAANDRGEYLRDWGARNYARKQQNDKDYYERNRERLKEYSREYYAQNRERQLKSEKLNYWLDPEKHRAAARAAYLENPEKYKRWTADAKMRRKRREVKWSLELTDFVYMEAKRLAIVRKWRFGHAWAVDHVYPMRGATVSGLHVWNNFQVIPAFLNGSKGNRLKYLEPFTWMHAL